MNSEELFLERILLISMRLRDLGKHRKVWAYGCLANTIRYEKGKAPIGYDMHDDIMVIVFLMGYRLLSKTAHCQPGPRLPERRRIALRLYCLFSDMYRADQYSSSSRKKIQVVSHTAHPGDPASHNSCNHFASAR